MNISEFGKILAAILVLTISWSIVSLFYGDFAVLSKILLFSTLIIFVSVFSKKLMAHLVDADVEHDIWKVQRYWFFPGAIFSKPVPAGIVLPAFFSIFTIGAVKLSTILTYETRVRKSRKAKRFGYYSFSEMTDWHNGIIGSAGIVSVLALGALIYFLPYNNLELLTKMAVYYAFWNLFPISNLDGSQIFFGSRTIWAILGTITLIMTSLSFLIHI